MVLEKRIFSNIAITTFPEVHSGIVHFITITLHLSLESQCSGQDSRENAYIRACPESNEAKINLGQKKCFLKC